MGDHTTWIHFLQPFYNNVKTYLSHYMKREWTTVGLAPSHFEIIHVVIALMVVIFLVIGAIRYSGRVKAGEQGGLVPEKKFGFRNFFELVTDATMGIATGVMGKKNAEKFLPLVGTLVFFILLNNLIGLVPGMIPATDTLKTNLALAGLVFVITHALGLKEHGISYLKHFMGPLWWLAPLMLPIEIVSHLVRPISLSLRLMGNMFADHKVLGTFFMLFPLLLPLPAYVLGLLVCIVQTLVFSLLTMIYINEAVSHEAH